MGWREWMVRRLAREVKFQVLPSRVIEDVKISVERGLSGTRQVQVQAWEPGMAQELLWNIWDGIDAREKKNAAV